MTLSLNSEVQKFLKTKVKFIIFRPNTSRTLNLKVNMKSHETSENKNRVVRLSPIRYKNKLSNMIIRIMRDQHIDKRPINRKKEEKKQQHPKYR